MPSSSDSEFEGYLQEFSVVDSVDGSDISISDVDTDDLSSDDAVIESSSNVTHILLNIYKTCSFGEGTLLSPLLFKILMKFQ